MPLNVYEVLSVQGNQHCHVISTVSQVRYFVCLPDGVQVMTGRYYTMNLVHNLERVCWDAHDVTPYQF